MQHAHNPVNWFAWSEEVFRKAKAENNVDVKEVFKWRNLNLGL